MSLYHLFFLGLLFAFLYHEMSYHYEMRKTIHMTNFLKENLFDKHTNNLFQFL